MSYFYSSGVEFFLPNSPEGIEKVVGSMTNFCILCAFEIADSFTTFKAF